MFERLPAFFMGFGVAAAAASYFIREDITGSHALLAKQVRGHPFSRARRKSARGLLFSLSYDIGFSRRRLSRFTRRPSRSRVMFTSACMRDEGGSPPANADAAAAPLSPARVVVASRYRATACGWPCAMLMDHVFIYVSARALETCH